MNAKKTNLFDSFTFELREKVACRSANNTLPIQQFQIQLTLCSCEMDVFSGIKNNVIFSRHSASKCNMLYPLKH